MSAETLAWLASAVTFAVSMSGTPGPNNAMVASSGATFGFARTVPHMLGIAVGFPVMLVAVALGAGELMRTVPALHTVLKWAGAAYLLWLAFRIATAQPSPAGSGANSRPLTFLQAGLFQWVNPKAWVIALGAVATYTTAEDVLRQSLGLAAIFLVVTMPAVAFWTLTGVGAARLLRTERSLRAFNWAMAALLVLSLLPLLREV
jgi:threonine/homoserine/homoserine lactone efflux protein